MLSKLFSIVMSVILFIGSLLGIRLGPQQPPSDMITYSKDQKVVTIAVSENGSTGYTWKHQISDLTVLKLTDDTFLPPAGADSGLVGAPGTRMLSFAGLRAGKATVTLQYLREWENKIPARTIVIEITVSGDLTMQATLISDLSPNSAK